MTDNRESEDHTDYFGHTVGSHSDDRGGDSDNPCYCNLETMAADTTDEALREQIENIIVDTSLHPVEASLIVMSLILSREQALLERVEPVDVLISHVMGTNKKAWLERPSHKDSRHKYVRADVAEQRYIDGLWESRNYIASQRTALATIKGEEK